MHSLQESKLENGIVLTSDIEELIAAQLTKQMIRILQLLQGDELTNKDLALKMNLTSSALSNILARMKKSDVELLRFQKRDKYIYYSLTPIASEYVTKNLTARLKTDFKVIAMSNRTDYLFHGCKECILAMRDDWGDDFNREFFTSLVQYFGKVKDNVSSNFTNFMINVEKMVIAQDDSALEEALMLVSEQMIKDELKKYIDKCKSLRKLCELDNENWRLAYELVDSFVDTDGTSISFEVLCKCETLSKTDVIGICYCLASMLERVKEDYISKNDFFDIWGQYFEPQEKLLYYIAEKCIKKYYAR